jgi:hypothetical protein
MIQEHLSITIYIKKTKDNLTVSAIQIYSCCLFCSVRDSCKNYLLLNNIFLRVLSNENNVV